MLRNRMNLLLLSRERTLAQKSVHDGTLHLLLTGDRARVRDLSSLVIIERPLSLVALHGAADLGIAEGAGVCARKLLAGLLEVEGGRSTPRIQNYGCGPSAREIGGQQRERRCK